MHYDLILKNGILVTPAETFTADVAVKNGKIAATDLGLSDTADEIFDAAGLHILPGIIDAHVHFRDPGLTEKEDFETGSAAAAFGGVTLIADMPNVLPVTSTVERFNEKVLIAREKAYVDFALFALLTNENIYEMEDLQRAGALGFKVFLGSSTGDIAAPAAGTLLEQIKKSASLGMRIGFHAENGDINSHFTSVCRNTTGVSEAVLLSQARPVISEVMAIKDAICYAQYTGAKIHIHHVTSQDGERLIEEAKQKGINVSAETCPHYLLLDTNSKAVKVYPPVRNDVNRKGLWHALGSGIDMIASDHAPHTAPEKALPVWEAPAGLSGVETSVRLMLNEVNKGSLTLNSYAALASEMPAKIWGIYPQKGNLLPGADADFTVVDMKKKSVILKDKLHSKSKTSVFDGVETTGLPAATIVRGRFVMKDGELTGEKGAGCLVSPVHSVN
ncbi:MAG: dihydroorotase family protein [Treponema sp.]|jgi:dihydroorotase|nr:dihydroorotase family protein [Treponema sp.]